MDEKIDLIEAEFGLTGFAVVVKLYQWIYTRGYYCEWTEEVALLFSRTRCGLGGSVVSEIVSAAIRRGIFDKDMFDKYGILTSRGIQKRYFEAVSRRKCVNVKKQYLLIPVDNLLKNVDINWVNDNINPKNDNNNPQSKVKESKGKKRKEYNEAAPADAGDGQEYLVRLPLKDGKNFTISEADVKQWEDLYPLVNVQQELKLMLGWLQGNPQKRKTMAGIKRFIHAWLARAQQNGGKGYGVSSGASKEQPGGEKSVGKVQRHGDYF